MRDVCKCFCQHGPTWISSCLSGHPFLPTPPVSSPAGSPTCELQAPARCCTHPNNQPRAPVTLVLPLGRQAPRGARAAAEGTRPGAGPLGLSSHHSSAEARECKTGSL